MPRGTSDRPGRALALARAFAGVPARPDPQALTLDDLILGSMERTMEKLRMAHEVWAPVCYRVELEDGTEVTFQRPAEMPDWLDRICQIVEQSAQAVETMKLSVTARELALRIMGAEGWVLNPKTLKTPPWMDPFREVEVGVVDEVLRRYGVDAKAKDR